MSNIKITVAHTTDLEKMVVVEGNIFVLFHELGLEPDEITSYDEIDVNDIDRCILTILNGWERHRKCIREHLSGIDAFVHLHSAEATMTESIKLVNKLYLTNKIE